MELVRYRTDEGTRATLVVTEGPKWLHIIAMDCPMKIAKVPKAEGRFMTPMPGYPMDKALRIFRKAARRYNGSLTGGLREALQGVTKP